MKPSDLIPGRKYAGPAGQVRQLLQFSESRQRVQYCQITTAKQEGGGRIPPGETRWVDTASFCSWAVSEVAS